MVIWLERSEDRYSIPIEDLIASTNLENTSDTFEKRLVIFVHLLKNGLLQITLDSSESYTTIPLLDGMIISRHNLGPFLRQTVLNTTNRQRIETDSSQSPSHVLRRFKIQDMVKVYRSKKVEAELFANLFV